jgi:hypothetical protein
MSVYQMQYNFWLNARQMTQTSDTCWILAVAISNSDFGTDTSAILIIKFVFEYKVSAVPLLRYCIYFFIC